MDRSERLRKLTRVVRSAVADLFDQTKPFGRLALVHTLLSAGSTTVTVGLAGTLFFSISLKEAESKVLLYLLITIAPFAVVAPALSPLLDRGRQARRSAVAIAAGGSTLLCVALVQSVKGLLLFPEVLGILVLSKLYLVARAALVPAMAAPGDDLASANARLAVLAALAGFAVSPIAIGFLQIGASATMGMAAVVFAAGLVAAIRLPRLAVAGDAVLAPARSRVDPASAAYGAPASLRVDPASAAYGAPAVVPAPALGSAAAPVYGPPLPLALGYADSPPSPPGPGRSPGHATRHRPGGSAGDRLARRARSIGPRRQGLGLAQRHPAVLSGFTAMCVVRGSVGFVTFFLAFALKREGAAAWWYGFIVVASGIGGLAGSMLVPRARRHVSEERLIFASLLLGALFALATALIGGMWAQPLLTFVIGLAGTTAKPSFDSLVQREVPVSMQGRAFARFETWLQLVWVVAALIAVLIGFGLGAGDVVVAVACGIAACFYASMAHGVHPNEAPAGRHHVGEPAAS